MSSSNMRIYQVVSITNPLEKLEIRGLATKEKEFVISNVTKTQAWKDANHGETDRRTTFAYEPENIMTEAELLSHFQPLLQNGVSIFDAVKGTYLNTALPAVTSVNLIPATVSKQRNTTPQQFTATCAPAGSNQNIIWSIAPVTAGLTISNAGLVTISAAVPAADYTVTAKSAEDQTKLDTSVLTVTA